MTPIITPWRVGGEAVSGVCRHCANADKAATLIQADSRTRSAAIRYASRRRGRVRRTHGELKISAPINFALGPAGLLIVGLGGPMVIHRFTQHSYRLRGSNPVRADGRPVDEPVETVDRRAIAALNGTGAVDCNVGHGASMG